MSASPQIRVMVVDDHAMLRRGLRFFLKGYDDLELVAEAGGGREAVALCAQVKPDVILMDMMMPDIDGPQATLLIRQQFPATQVIALTSFNDDQLIGKALQAGAIGYLIKNASAQELADAIRRAYAGHSSLAPEAARTLIEASRQKYAAPRPDYKLSDREREVLALMAEGLSNAEIATQLVVSLATAKFHVRRILTKLNVSSRTEAVALAWQQKLLG